MMATDDDILAGAEAWRRAGRGGRVRRPPRAAHAGSQISLLAPRNEIDPAEGQEESGQEESSERKVEGKRLITLIKRTLIDRNLPDRYIADLMGVTTIYWNSMCNGHRKIKSTSFPQTAPIVGAAPRQCPP